MNIESIIQQNIPLAPLTTYKIGGKAKYFIEIKSKDELIKALDWAKERREKYVILGGGSNILVSDSGFDGLVVQLKNEDLSVKGDRLECGAGVPLSRAASTAMSNSLSGLEWSVGIPRATIGGAARGNAGAFDICMANIVEMAEVYNHKSKRFMIFSNRDSKFDYRYSIFKAKDELIIWNVTLRLSRKNIDKIREFTDKVLEFRNGHYPRLPSAGSVFENLDSDFVKDSNNSLYEEALRAGKAERGLISAGYLIDRLGLKGKKIGGAKISLEHANHIVNTGRASADDVVMLISYIKQQVREKLKIQLHEEIAYFGF